MTKLYMYVGLPGSGKSTHAALLAEELHCDVISSDAIRKEWYGDENVQGNAAKIFEEVHKRCKERLARGENVIMDATNLNAKRRISFLNSMPDGILKCCVVMATPFTQCITRDASRSRQVGIRVLEKMRKNFQMPYYNEGWDHIEVVYGDEVVDSTSHFEQEKLFDQHNYHHTLTVGNHEAAAAEYAERQEWDTIVAWAADFHDCGKIHCQVFKEGDPDAHYYGHESVSAYTFLTMDIAKTIYVLGATRKVVECAALITWHMVPYTFGEGKTYAGIEQWCANKGFDEDFAEHLAQLHEADLAAH